jgi:hypothetical protein
MRTARMQKRQFNLSCIEKYRWHRDFLQTGQLTNDLRRFHRRSQDAYAQRHQDRAVREGERQGSRLSYLRGPDLARRRVAQDFGRGPRIPLDQARRSELPGAERRWSRSKAVTATLSSGPAAAQTEPKELRRPAHRAGRLFRVARQSLLEPFNKFSCKGERLRLALPRLCRCLQ